MKVSYPIRPAGSSLQFLIIHSISISNRSQQIISHLIYMIDEIHPIIPNYRYHIKNEFFSAAPFTCGKLGEGGFCLKIFPFYCTLIISYLCIRHVSDRMESTSQGTVIIKWLVQQPYSRFVNPSSLLSKGDKIFCMFIVLIVNKWEVI